MASWRSVDARCPFYQGDTPKAIVCEGLVVGERIRRRFPDEKTCSVVFGKHCSGCFEECPVFQLVYGTYQGGRKK